MSLSTVFICRDVDDIGEWASSIVVDSSHLEAVAGVRLKANADEGFVDHRAWYWSPVHGLKFHLIINDWTVAKMAQDWHPCNGNISRTSFKSYTLWRSAGHYIKYLSSRVDIEIEWSELTSG